MTEPPNTSIHLISGEVFDFLDPMSATITPHDVAHALARVQRYGGHHAATTYSVAQHTLLCCQLVLGWYHDQQHGFAALNHDNPEIITGDWTTPMKNWIRALGVDYGAKIEAPIELAICKQLGLVMDDLHAGVVKEADAAAYEIEVRALKPNGYASYVDLEEDLLTYGGAWLARLLALSVPEVEASWLNVYHAFIEASA
jgi:hypothetical protein